MKKIILKILFYIPAIIFTALYGVLAIEEIGAISPVVIIWLTLFFASGFLLAKDKFWGCVLGVMPALHLIYMGTQATGQIINETPIGIIVLIFYVACGGFIYWKTKKTQK
ncbi:MAG: hypothetical protein RR064_00520 [Oscillospiraceae bacterium]